MMIGWVFFKKAKALKNANIGFFFKLKIVASKKDWCKSIYWSSFIIVNNAFIILYLNDNLNVKVLLSYYFQILLFYIKVILKKIIL